MTWRRLTATLGLLAALTAGESLRPQQALALQAGFRAGGDSDTFTVSADSGSLPKYSVRRSGAKELTVTFDASAGEKAPAAPGVGGSKLVSGVRLVPGGFKILLKTSAFGYVNFPNSGKSQLQIQIFPDAVGSMWSSAKPEAKPAAKPEAKPEPKAAAEKKAPPEQPEKSDKSAATDKKAEAERFRAEKLSEKQRQDRARVEEAARKKAEAEVKREQAAQAKRDKLEEARREKEAKVRAAEEAKHPAAPTAQTSPAQAAAPAAAQPAQLAAPSAQAQSAPASDGQPFFSVPYSMRAPVNKTVLGLPSGSTTTLPPVSGQSGQPAQPASVPEKPAAQEKPRAAAPNVGGKLPPGVVEKPILQEQTSSTPPRTVETALPQPPQIAPVDVAPDMGKAEVRFRADRRGPEDSRPSEMLSGVPASARSAAAPAQLAQAPAAQTKGAQTGHPWELRQPVQKIVVSASPAANATLPQMAAALETPATPPGHAPEPQPTQPPQPDKTGTSTANASDHAPAPATEAHGPAPKEPAKEGGKDAHGKDKEPQGPATLDQLKDKILMAQSNMVSGKWTEAVKALEDVLREPGLKGDLREETLYSLADAYMQAYKDSLAANYDRIVGAQQTAMNANQKSSRVPRALINLGLLNLKVGNLAEAKAYFNVVKKKYPHDQNAAIVPFSLGEYYRGKGDLKKAADEYQNLIQNYPDSRMAKDTAFILAQTLRKLGSFEKAFQIVDYIDKRWPLFYMENPPFLKLAAEVEEKVGKLPQAKDHYWTYYNLNPDNEFADITLVRIGDIYLRQNKRTAAKEVYQKALRDFPDREGGQVARMRLAEEGIYDDPTMGEMVSVFGRPESLRPNEAYELIMTKYPQSPLAPLSQIKLGMYQFYTKAYLEAMNTANSFLDKYPKSPLIGKAKELGFQSFIQALPGLMQDGNYQRILQLYDTSPFVKENQDKLGDEAQMAIAVSAWKRGDPDRALKLAGRFLGKKQVPKYSEMALDLAMSIFLERKEWSRISELAARANAAWKLSPRQKTQFENARAMALENQGDTEKSLPLWTRIAADTTADPATRAHATYVLAKDAARKQDMHRLFALSQDALAQLLATGGDADKIKDCLLMAITATERSGRFKETVKWGKEFDRIIPDSDPDWAPVRLRLADIYRKGGAVDEWKTLLQDVVKKKPNTVYSRMASQALESNALDMRLQNYLTKPPR